MADGALFVQSLWIGLSIAAPVGPIGLLVIQRTLQHGRAVGLATGLGAAAADAAYGAVGAYGVSTLIGVLQGARVPLALVGGAFLLWLAWRTWRSARADVASVGAGGGEGSEGGESGPGEAPVEAPPRLWSSFMGTLLLTLSNPATILSFIAIFGALAGQGRPASPAVMVAGVLLGSALWWLLLSTAVSALRNRFDARARRAVGRASALMLAAFALWQWASLRG